MSLKRIVNILVFCGLGVSCSTPQPATEVVLPTSEPTVTTESLTAPAGEAPVQASAPVDTDTVESLSKDVDGLERHLIQYSGPLTPKQESEVESIKKKIHNKESKKAKLELQKMLGDWKEEE